MPSFVQRAAQTGHDHAPDQRGVTKADFRLGRVDVHINFGWRHVEEQRDDRMAIAWQHLGISPSNRAHQQAVAHRASVDEQILMVGDPPVEGRQARNPAQRDRVAPPVDRDRIFRQRPVGQARDSPRPLLTARNGQDTPPVMLQRESDIGPRHRQPTDRIETRGIFRAGRAQEFAPGGHAREQVLDHDPGAGRHGGGAVAQHLAIVDHPAPAVAPRRSALDRDSRDTGDRGQSFAPKSEGCDRFDRLVGQLGGAVPLQRQRHVLGRHTTSVVGHLDPADAALPDRHRDPGRARVDGIFDQFLQRTGGPFHHFTGRDTIDEMGRQTPY